MNVPIAELINWLMIVAIAGYAIEQILRQTVKRKPNHLGVGTVGALAIRDKMRTGPNL